jgi:hypothetical protein
MNRENFLRLLSETLKKYGFTKEKSNFFLRKKWYILGIYPHASNFGKYYNINYGISFIEGDRGAPYPKELSANLRWQFPMSAEYEVIDSDAFVTVFEKELKNVMPKPGQSEKAYLTSKLDLVGGGRQENIDFVMGLPDR